ncbi:MAG: hypothetical protein PHD48_09910 [Alphaproteobacteria bacterium]|nr:hypothetical protein [Alphaproteobacteria bacterium]
MNEGIPLFLSGFFMTYANNNLNKQIRPSLRKLMADFGHKMRQIHQLSLKVGVLSQRAGTKPSLWVKLDQWRLQLSGLQRKEQATLSRIKAIEVQHQKLRLKKQLKMARPLVGLHPSPSARNKNKALWYWILAIYMIMLRPKKMAPQRTLTNG